MGCLSDNTVVDLVERRLDDARRAVIYAHLDDCAACREIVAAAALELDDPPVGSTAGELESFVDDETMEFGPSPGALREGHDVDHFRVLRRLGRGGMGEVYLAYDTSLDRKVALTLVKPELLRKESSRRLFMTEAKATARLSHPNIVTIHGVGEHLGQPYVALELLSGRTLRERLSFGRTSPEEVIRVGLAIASALSAAHESGVFHRDLKPANVMLCLDGRARVLDFGLAKIADGDLPTLLDEEGLRASSTRVGGTPAYMAPEQWRKETISGATDVWALGVILHEMGTGRLPFELPREGNLTTQLVKLRERVCKAALDVRPLGQLPQPLASLIVRCLDKDPKRRPTSGEVAQLLRKLELEQTMSSMAELPVMLPRSRPFVVPAAGLFGAAIALTVALWLRPPVLLVAQPALEDVSLSIPPISPPAATEEPPAPREAAEPPPVRVVPRTTPARPAETAEPWDPMSYR